MILTCPWDGPFDGLACVERHLGKGSGRGVRDGFFAPRRRARREKSEERREKSAKGAKNPKKGAKNPRRARKIRIKARKIRRDEGDRAVPDPRRDSPRAAVRTTGACDRGTVEKRVQTDGWAQGGPGVRRAAGAFSTRKKENERRKKDSEWTRRRPGEHRAAAAPRSLLREKIEF